MYAVYLEVDAIVSGYAAASCTPRLTETLVSNKGRTVFTPDRPPSCELVLCVVTPVSIVYHLTCGPALPQAGCRRKHDGCRVSVALNASDKPMHLQIKQYHVFIYDTYQLR